MKLSDIKGLGIKAEEYLNELGIYIILMHNRNTPVNPWLSQDLRGIFMLSEILPFKI